MLKNKCLLGWLLKTPKASIVIFVFNKDFKLSKMVYHYFSRKSHRLKKKRRNRCHKTKLGNQDLVLIGAKNEIWPHFTYCAYSKQLLMQQRCTFWGSYLQNCRLTLYIVVYKCLRKCGSSHNVSRNV